MEIILKSNYTIEDLQNGKKIECDICHKGIYRPFNSKFKVNHAYVCDNCGSCINIDPVVEVK